MKLIDENGKILGKINIIDLAVVAVAIVAIFFVGQKLLNKETVQTTASTENQVVFYATANNVDENVAKSFHVGEKIVAEQGVQNGQIDEVIIEPADYVMDNPDGSKTMLPHPYLKKITAKITCVPAVDGVKKSIGGQEIKVGQSYWIKTAGSQVFGLIIEVQDEE